MHQSLSSQRPSCPHCLRPLSVCLCAFIKKIDNNIKVSIFRHPSEVKNAKGTAALTALCLKNCNLINTETVQLCDTPKNHRRVLLFPPIDNPVTTPSDAGYIETHHLHTALAAEKTTQHIELIVLDGTWRKARKMYYLSKDLQMLPKLHLNSDALTGHYIIRKAEKMGQLSTLEAIAAALSQIENNSGKYQPLLDLQQAMINKQLALMTPDTRQRYRQEP